MSEEDSGAEKSFDATPKRLEDARKKGEIPKSTDITTAMAYLGFILAVVVGLPFVGKDMMQMLSGLVAQSDHFAELLFAGATPQFIGVVGKATFLGVLPIVAIPAFGVLIALIAQRTFVFAPKKLAPKLSRISPISGAKNKFGPKGLFEFAKSAVKLTVVSLLLVWFMVSQIDNVMAALFSTPEQIILQLGDLIVEFLLLIFGLSLVIGGVDYLWQVAEHYRKNRMSHKEIKDETKQSEGDPHHKQTRRQRAYDIAMNQMLSDVPTADVVIVNPTHYAVALKWDRNSKQAPVCVAKGVDEIAAKIREIATASKISIHSDPPTARALHATISVGQVIEPEHYKAVAAAIRFVEEMRAKAKGRVTS